MNINTNIIYSVITIIVSIFGITSCAIGIEAINANLQWKHDNKTNYNLLVSILVLSVVFLLVSGVLLTNS
jgi:hypothetical protein